MIENDGGEMHSSAEINWNAESVNAIVFVELPFWLMVPNHTQRIEVEQCEFTIDIVDHFYELYDTEMSDSRSTCIYIGPKDKVNQETLDYAKNAGKTLLWRKCKTTLKIHSNVNKEIFDMPDENYTLRLYLKAFFLAHFEVVNKLIEKYRFATYDYFPHSITPWSAPVWWVSSAQRSLKLCLVEYRGWDHKPNLNDGQNRFPYVLLSPEDLGKSIKNRSASPGEHDLINALHMMETGDYNGAVRRVTTAIEVLAEELLLLELKSRYNQEEMDRLFNKIKNNFPEKMEKYLEMSDRKLPNWIREQLEKIRKMRQRIVHYAHQIDYNNRGAAQELVDKGRWIYNWFENEPHKSELREHHIALRSLGRDLGSIYRYEITSKGIVVKDDWPD